MSSWGGDDFSWGNHFYLPLKKRDGWGWDDFPNPPAQHLWKVNSHRDGMSVMVNMPEDADPWRVLYIGKLMLGYRLDEDETDLLTTGEIEHAE